MQEIRQQWPWRAAGTPPAVLAHRGAGPARENTVAAFAAALAAGADGVELDVRSSASGTVVVHHDPEVPGAGPLHLLEDSELPGWLPTLEEALDACAGAVVDVEIKSSPPEAGHDPDGRLAAEVAALVADRFRRPGAPAHVLVSCFWPGPLQAVRAARPGLSTGLLVSPALDAADALPLAEELGVGVLLPFRSQAGAELVEAAHGHGLAVWPWTVDEAPDLAAVSDAGVDAVITDRVELAVAVLREH